MFIDHQDKEHRLWKRAWKRTSGLLWQLLSHEEVQLVTVCLALAVTLVILVAYFLPAAEPNWIP